MGLLIEHTPHDEAHYHELTLAIPCEEGETFTRLNLKDREAVYQAVLDTIRRLGGTEL